MFDLDASFLYPTPVMRPVGMVLPSHRLNAAIVRQLMDLPEYKEIHPSTEMDDLLSAMAVIEVGDAVLKLVTGGGEQRGRKILTAAQIQAAVEEFKANALWAVLRTTSGRGLRLDDTSGMAKLVDGREAETPVAFEVTHYGGSSIAPRLSVTLGKLVTVGIEWQSGLSYESPDGRRARVGESLVLTRFLVAADFASDELLGRVWEDIIREASHATLLYTDGALPKVYGGGQRGNARAVLSQELTTLVSGVVLDHSSEFSYRVRSDKVVEVQRTVDELDFTDDTAFASVLDAFRRECMRVYTLFCQPLNEGQKKLLGRPGGEIHGMATTPKLSWQAQREGSGVIGFHPGAKNRENAVFPADGWGPEKGKLHRVFCVRKGRGFTCYPAPAAYIERFAQKDDVTAVRQIIRVEYDGGEKIIRDAEEIPLRKTEKWIEGNSWSSRGRIHRTVFVIMLDGEIMEAERDSNKAYVYGDLPVSVLILVHNHDDYGYRRTEQWEAHHLPQTATDAQRVTVKEVEEATQHYFRGPGTGWDLRQVGTVTFTTAYHRDFVGDDAKYDDEMRANLPIDVTKWEQSVGDDGKVVVGPYRRRVAETHAAQKKVPLRKEDDGIPYYSSSSDTDILTPLAAAFAAAQEHKNKK